MKTTTKCRDGVTIVKKTKDVTTDDEEDERSMNVEAKAHRNHKAENQGTVELIALLRPWSMFERRETMIRGCK